MARWLAIGTMLAVAVPGLAVAQQRTPNPGTQAMLRQWPEAGVWETHLQRRTDIANSPLECVGGTGFFSDPVNYYRWGWADLNGEFRLFIWDRLNVSVDRIDVFIDDVKVVQAKVTSKEAPDRGSAVYAAISREKVDALKAVIRKGSSIKFMTAKETYSAPLDGADQALTHFDECIAYAKQLTIARKPVSRRSRARARTSR